jgi:hypothetical protein
MSEPVAAAGPQEPRTGSEPEAAAPGRLRLASFRVTYVAILAFVLASLTTIDQARKLLGRHFQGAVARAVEVSPANGPIIPQIEGRVKKLLGESPWIRWGDVEVDVQVFSADGRTTLFAIGRAIPPPPGLNPHQLFLEAIDLLPALPNVVVEVPPLSGLAAGIVLFYGAGLVTYLFFYTRRVERRDAALLSAAVTARDESARRARDIESELGRVQERLRKVEPGEREHAEEIRRLDAERTALRQKLDALAEREAELRASAARATELDEERRALEDLLEEAMDDLGGKEAEIQDLQTRLKRAARAPAASGKGRARAAEQWGRRLNALYKNLEFDTRAIQDLVALGDESLRLRAEEGIKRLSDDSESAAVRRKVGGLPPQLSIFELGFAGKGRIYYTRGRQQRYRILAIGGKASQKSDLEYLSRLPSA